MTAVPWGALLAAAARLGVPPEAFWRMAVKEWRLMAEANAGPEAMGREALAALVAKYPDKEEA